jgi:hypothetical protein
MDSFLREQVSQRASNSDRLNSLIQQTKGEQFEEWRDDANKLFDAQLNDYSNKASEYVQNKIASTTEGAGVLTNVPHFYNLGTGFYKNVLGEKGKIALDETAKGLKIVKDKVNQKIAEKTGLDVEKTAGDVKTRINNIADQAQGELPESSTKLYTYDGVQTAETPKSVVRPQNEQLRDINNNNPFRQNLQPTEERPPSSNPTLETRNNLANIETQSSDEIMRTGDINATLSAEEKQAINTAQESIPLAEEAEPLVNTTTELGSAPYLGTASGAVGEGGTTTFGGAGAGEAVGETGLLEGTTELGAADAALASTGIGAPLAGLIAVGGAIAFGLDELLHHSHKPKAPVMPYSSATPAISTQYNLSSTILPTGSSLQSRGGTMTF